MIAGKTRSEILTMQKSTRSYWYKSIPLEEKEEIMRMMENVRKNKISVSHMGKTLSKKTRDKISASKIGHTTSEKTRAKISAAATGRILSDKTKAKISAAISGGKHPMYGKTHYDNAKAKMSEAATERMRDSETRAKISAATIEQWKDSEYRENHSGENHYNWQGGISTLPYGTEFNSHLKKQIRERDNHTCQECHQTEEQLGRTFDVHHIDYDKQNNSPENLISLCRSCHAQTNFGREDWTEYFRTIIVNNRRS